MFDVIVAGAGLAGSTAAIKFAEQGLNVALLERSPDPAHHKRACTHEIQAGGAWLLEELGLVEELQAAGMKQGGIVLDTPYGWVRADVTDDYPHPRTNVNVRRSVLDPLLRRRAAQTSGVELMLGRRVESVLRTNGRVCGVLARDRSSDPVELRARLVVAADGTDSAVAKSAALRQRVHAHERFGYWNYFADVALPYGRQGHIWFMDPDIAYALPTDTGLTMMSIVLHKRRLPEFKRDPEALFWKTWSEVPDGPPIDGLEPIGPFLGRVHQTTHVRPAAARGLALIGDAARTVDYVWGWGCTWAMESASMVVDDTAGALHARGRGLDRALLRYRLRHTARYAARHAVAASYATGRPFNVFERTLYRRATHDNDAAKRILAFATLCAGPAALVSPSLPVGGGAGRATQPETAQRSGPDRTVPAGVR